MGGAYVGPDRRTDGLVDRRAAGWDEHIARRIWRAAGVGLMVVGALAVAAVTVNPLSASAAATWSAGLNALAAGLGVLVTLLALLHLRWTGQTRSVWLGIASLVVVVLAAGGASAATAMSVTPGGAARAAALAVAAIVLATAVWGPTVDERLGLRRALGETLLVLTVVWVLVQGLLRFGPWPPGPDSQFVLEIVLGIGLLLLAVGAMRDAGGDSHVNLAPWVTWLLAGLGVSVVARAFGYLGNDAWVLAGGMMRVVTMVTAVLGLGVVLWDTLLRQQRELYHRRIDSSAQETRQRELAHEANNALMAIEGATVTLERYRDRLADEDREALTSAVTDEIRRLQRLVSLPDDEEEAGTVFDLATVAARQAALARSRGCRVVLDAPGELLVEGDAADVAEALQNLLVNAERHAGSGPDRPIRVTAGRDGGYALVRVDDRGPGVTPDERGDVFEAGRTGRSPAAGQGLGLHVARRLVRGQRGELWLADTDGPGASFVLAVPSASGGAAGQGADEVDDARQPVEGLEAGSVGVPYQDAPLTP